MTYIGAPMLYYGDEIGMMGGRDPDCRRTMIWDTLHWNIDLQNFYKKVIKIRNDYLVFRRGTYKTILADNKNNLFGFLREYKNQKAIVIINNSDLCQSVTLSQVFNNIKTWNDVLNNKVLISNKRKSLSVNNILPYSGVVLITN